jgi:hypothetical protein
MARRAKESLAVEKLEVLADRGYYDSQEVAACSENGVSVYIPLPCNSSSNKRSGLYGKEDFRYDAEVNCYLCPAGQKLTYRFSSQRNGREILYCGSGACKTCRFKDRCTLKKKGRYIWRWANEAYLDEMAQRVRSQPEKVKQRRALVEHPFGTMKNSMHQRDFLTRGLANVRTEMSLTVLAYNLRRVLSLKGTHSLLEGLGT